jgi:hypothetical protein
MTVCEVSTIVGVRVLPTPGPLALLEEEAD